MPLPQKIPGDSNLISLILSAEGNSGCFSLREKLQGFKEALAAQPLRLFHIKGFGLVVLVGRKWLSADGIEEKDGLNWVCANKFRCAQRKLILRK